MNTIKISNSKLLKTTSSACALLVSIFLLLPVATSAEKFDAAATAPETSIRPTIEFQKSWVHRMKWNIEPSQFAYITGGADYYIIEYGKNYDLPNPHRIIVDGGQESFTLRNLRSARRYYVRIQAVYNDGQISWKMRGDNWTKPNRPRFLKVRDKTSTSATLKWRRQYREGWFTRYELKVYKVRKNKKPLLIFERFLVTTDNKQDLVNFKPGKKYYFKVRARVLNQAWSRWSDKKYFRMLEE